MRKTEIENGTDRRTVLMGAAATAALVMAATPSLAVAAGDMADVKNAIAAGHAEAVKRLQDWIALPTIAAEGRNTPQGAQYMAKLATDAGFQNVEIVQTSGIPGVFGTMDNGAAKTLGVYFMYDVKQFNPAEWPGGDVPCRALCNEGRGPQAAG
jgi:hypothetical protein